MIDNGASHIDPGGAFEADKPRRWIDLSDQNPAARWEEIDTADAKADSPGRRHGELYGFGLGPHARDAAPAGGVGTPLPVNGFKTRRCYNLRAHHQQSEALAAGIVILLNHQLVADSPQRIEDPFEVIQGPTADHTDPHPGSPLFDHHRESKVVLRRGRNGLRVGTGNGEGHWKPRFGQNLDRSPMIPSGPDRRRWIRCYHPPSSHDLQEGEQAVRSPISDPRENNLRVFFEECLGTTVDLAVLTGSQFGGIDEIEGDTG